MKNANDPNQDFPMLQKAGNRSPFEAPEGYFEALPSQIRDKMSRSESTSFITLPRLAWAMSVVAVLFIGNYFISDYVSSDSSAQIQITSDHIEEAGYLSLLEEEMILESFTQEQLDTLSSQTGFDEYLIENRTDINLIISEL